MITLSMMQVGASAIGFLIGGITIGLLLNRNEKLSSSLLFVVASGEGEAIEELQSRADSMNAEIISTLSINGFVISIFHVTKSKRNR